MKDKTKSFNKINAEELAQQVTLQSLTRDTLMVFGPSGAGKTTIMRSAAADHFDRVVLSNFADACPTDVTGLGLPEWRKVDDSKVLEMVFSQPENIPTRDRVGDSLVYWILDEWGNYDPQVRAVFHGVLSPPDGSARRLGPHVLGPNVVVGLTSNRRCDGADVGRFSIPETRRAVLVTLTPDASSWWKWAETVPGYAETLVPAFVAYGDSVGAEATHKDHFLGDPADFDPLVPQAQPSPRAWEEVAKLLVLAGSSPGLRPAVKTAVRGRVGDKATDALFAFLNVASDPAQFEAFKADPSGYQIPDRVADQFTLASGSVVYSMRGVSDPHAATHQGQFDWLITGAARLRPEVGAYTVTAAERRGIKVSERNPKLWADLVG